MVPMRDGIRLYTRIVLPQGAEKCPTVFIRTPYEAEHSGQPHDPEEYRENPFLKNGYALVLQHCRGCGDSEGDCHPYAEREDGLDTLAYIRTLPHYNGSIYLFGESYLATVHLCYLNTQPPDVKGAVFNIQTDRMFFRNYRNGCCNQHCYLSWWLRMLKRRFPEQHKEGNVVRPYQDMMEKIIGQPLPEYTNNLLNDTYNEYWQRDPRTDAVEKFTFPVLFNEGWFDFYLEGMFSMWERLPEKIKEKSAMVVGPFGHGTKRSGRSPYPKLTQGDPPSGTEEGAALWFNSLRDGTPYAYAELGKVNYYSLGGDFWTTSVYPAQQQRQRFYFGADHRLSETPQGTGSVTYRYDPDERLGCFKFFDFYQAAEPGIDGVESFFSAPFVQTADFFGKVRWHMTVSSDCEDTAFFMRLYFEEDGKSYNLTETISSLSHFYPDYQPGTPVVLDVETPPIAFTMHPGMRLRADVASDGGIYVPNANVRGHWAMVREAKTAQNTVYFENSYFEV